MKAYVLIRTGGGKAKDVLESIREMEEISEAYGVYGSYDIIAKVEGENIADLVVDKIRILEGVVYTNTLIIAV